jgi:ketosteroid isomerase-like protein
MTKTKILVLAVLLTAASPLFAQKKQPANLQDTLWDVDQRWLCVGHYQKPYLECVKSRSEYWADGFFEVQSGGTLRNKSEMVITQSAASPALAVRPFPADFKLVTVYGDVAVGTDHTDFQTVGPDGRLSFTAGSHVLRVFVKLNGEWRPAAAALVPIIPPGPVATDHTGAASTKSPDEALEKQLQEIDQKWMDAARTAKLDYLKNLFTDRWTEIIGWDPTVILDKTETLDRLAKIHSRGDEGVYPDQFKLMAVYGNVALATDRRTRKWTDQDGHAMSTPHRTLLIFVKENGQWRSAGGALVPIAPSKP